MRGVRREQKKRRTRARTHMKHGLPCASALGVTVCHVVCATEGMLYACTDVKSMSGLASKALIT